MTVTVATTTAAIGRAASISVRRLDRARIRDDSRSRSPANACANDRQASHSRTCAASSDPPPPPTLPLLLPARGGFLLESGFTSFFRRLLIFLCRVIVSLHLCAGYIFFF